MTSATWQTDILGVQGTKAAKLGRNSGTEFCDGVTENLKLGQESFNLSYHLLVEMSLEKICRCLAFSTGTIQTRLHVPQVHCGRSKEI